MDIYEVLKKDHQEIKILMDELISLREDDDYRFILIEEIRNQLIPHSRAEESVFYNMLRAVNADRRLVFHVFQEHLQIETLLRTLQVMDRMNLDWKETAERLRRSFVHHVQVEEVEIFEEAKRVFTKDESISMGEAFEQLKPRIEKDGLFKNAVDMVMNMLPPRLTDKIRNFTENHID